jgi:hypothetical protein
VKPNVAILSFPYYGWNFINANGRALGWNANGVVSGAQRAITDNAWYIGFINSPAVDIPSGKTASYKGQYTIYNRGSDDAMVVLACVGGQSGAQPKLATTFVGNYAAGSWSNLPVSTTTFLLQCQTQYSQTNFCISLPTSGSTPILVGCNKQDKTQIFRKDSVNAYGK